MSQYYQSARSYYQKYQTQTQSYARKNKKKQKEKVAFAQSFQDQTDAVFKHLENVLKMLNAGDVFDEDVINLTTDMLIDSINLFAKNCHYCRENKNFDALKLAKKLIIDKWTKFSKKNKKKANKYYEFMMAALDSTKLIQINQERELTAHELKLQKKALSNPKNLNSGFAKIIGSGSRYEKKSAKYYEDKYNQQLETEHSRQLKQYKNNPKYQTDEDDNKQINRDVDDGADSFYFTKSGKQSKFKNAKRRKETEEEEVAINGVIKLSKRNKLGRHEHTMPCLILSEPNKNERKYHIRLAAPYAKETHWVSPGKYSIVTNNEHFIAKWEKQWVNYHQVALGYKSMEQKQQEMYPDVY